MDKKELAYAKQGAMATRSWDCFQRLIRRALRSGAGENRRTVPSMEAARGVVVTSLLVLWILSLAAPAPAMTRTLQQGPALVIVAFGTTTNARETYDAFEEQLKRELPEEWHGAPITWAYTSEIVRERVNKEFAAKGDPRRIKSLIQVLADLEDEGYRRIAVQSLHLFPGQEYEEMEKEIAAFRTLGLRIEYGGTLLHKWEMLFDAVNAVAPDFLPPADGCTLLVTHGTPQTFVGSNSTYLGLERYLDKRYDKVSLGTVNGILAREETLARVKSCTPAKVRIVPFMYVAGDHIMNDIMGEKPDKDGTPSWAMELKGAGVEVETVFADSKGRQVYKGLGLYPEINRILIRQLTDSLERLRQ